MQFRDTTSDCRGAQIEDGAALEAERLERIAAHHLDETLVGRDLDEEVGRSDYEYACHEGNYGLAFILSAGRAQDNAAPKMSRVGDRRAVRRWPSATFPC
jgi:hypothetical protein